MPMRRQDKIVVGFVWWLIAFQGLSFLYLFASKLFTHNSLLFWSEIPIFITIVSILCFCYFRATTAPPGTPNYQTNMNYSEQIQQLKVYSRHQSQQKKKRRKRKKVKGQIDYQQIQSLNKVSYCFKCDVVKQKRVHHCSICKKCIMRMDHHCPWVGNCVGKFNHKYFVLFLLYATTGLSMVAITITIDYFTGGFYASLQPDMGHFVWLYINCVTSYMLALSIGFLFVTQMMTACVNLTTLESFTQGVQNRNPFDVGSIKRNLQQIFGEGIWILPTNPFPYYTHTEGSGNSLQQVVAL